MQDFRSWSLAAIRDEGVGMSWMEQRLSEWAPLLATRLAYLLQGRAFIIITDREREWFEKYFLTHINPLPTTRPMLPFFSLRALYPRFDEISAKEQADLLEDMLSITFSNGFVYFYIGKSSDARAALAKSSDMSYMWLFDEQSQNGFYLNSSDERLDSKLVSLFKLFSKSVDAVLLAKASV